MAKDNLRLPPARVDRAVRHDPLAGRPARLQILGPSYADRITLAAARMLEKWWRALEPTPDCDSELSRPPRGSLTLPPRRTESRCSPLQQAEGGGTLEACARSAAHEATTDIKLIRCQPPLLEALKLGTTDHQFISYPPHRGFDRLSEPFLEGPRHPLRFSSGEGAILLRAPALGGKPNVRCWCGADSSRHTGPPELAFAERWL
jgi:hypothetical protein